MISTKDSALPVLIVDDEREITDGCEFTLQSNGIGNIFTCNDSRRVMPLLAEQEIAVILLDLFMPYISGEELLPKLSQRYPHLPVIVITGVNELDNAVKCMRMGAFDYMVKPVEEQRLISGIRRAIERQEERNEYRTFRQLVFNDDLKNPEAFSKMVTNNKSMRSLFQYTEAIAETDKPVLVTGPSGVGKELMAKAVHTLSGRSGLFVPVNIAGLDDSLFSDALFGHMKGAFTGAEKVRQGLIERASGGTLFLDEIGDMNTASQIKLLRLIEEGEFLPIGADVPKEANARIVAATNRDLQALRQREEFRTDLYYRLQTHHIHLPPLSERLDDLPLLVNHFLEQAAKTLGKRMPTPPRELFSLLAGYHFPGNIRELQSMVFDAVSHHKSKMLSMERFKVHIETHSSTDEPDPMPNKDQANIYSFFEKLPTLKEARRQLIGEALKRSHENKSAAARILGVTRSGLSKILGRDDG